MAKTAIPTQDPGLRERFYNHWFVFALSLGATTAAAGWWLCWNLYVGSKDETIRKLEKNVRELENNIQENRSALDASGADGGFRRAIAGWEIVEHGQVQARVLGATLLPRYQDHQMMLVCRIEDPTIDFFQDGRGVRSQLFPISSTSQTLGLQLPDEFVHRARTMTNPRLECYVMLVPRGALVDAIRIPYDVFRLRGSHINYGMVMSLLIRPSSEGVTADGMTSPGKTIPSDKKESPPNAQADH